MTSRPSSNLTAKYEEERIRAVDQSQFMHLQSQIDELRRLMKDQTNRYQVAMEQTRKTEAALVQIQSIIDQHREAVTLNVERNRRDIADLRREMAAARLQIDEFTSPIREIIAQIQQLGDARKQDREYVAGVFGRIEALEQQQPAVQNQIKALEDSQRQLTLQLDRLRDADTIALQEIRKLAEDTHVERLHVRRQIVDTQQLIEGYQSELQGLDSRIARLDDLHQRLDLTLNTFPEQITTLHAGIEVLNGEVRRVEQIATDWFMINQDRLEELRQQSNEKMDELRDIDQNHLRQLSAWLERLDSLIRELEQRQGRTLTRMEQVLQQHILRIRDLEQREVSFVKTLASTFVQQVENIESEVQRVRHDDPQE